jgi:hypothetical protein
MALHLDVCSFFKNGSPLGVAFSNVAEERLHPCIGLRTLGEEVLANFGGQPFKFDFENLMATYAEQVGIAPHRLHTIYSMSCTTSLFTSKVECYPTMPPPFILYILFRSCLLWLPYLFQ